MISPDGFEIRLRAENRDLFRREWDARQPPPAEAVPLPIRAEETFAILVRIPATGSQPALRLRLGEEVIAEVAAGTRYVETPDLPWLRNEYGESRVVLELDEGAGEGSGTGEPLFALEIAVVAREEVARDFRAMVRDVAAIHEGLAQDVTGRSFSRRRLEGGSVSLLHPRAMLNRLREVHRHLEASIALIAKQPSVTLARSVRLARYRGGDRIDAAAAASAARDPGTRLGATGRVVALGKLLVRGPVLSEDLPEHRHIAEGLRRLSNRAEGLARHCGLTAGRLEADARRWAPARAGIGSVPVAALLPVSGASRAVALRRLAADARLVAEDFQVILRRHPFLAEAGQPRTDFGPTPAFLGRPAYREVYRALVRARQALGVVIDGDDVRIAHRSLPTLYEYWCFLRAVGHLHRRLGRPGSNLTFSLIDDIYRPDLTPGQHFRFEAAGAQVVATYEPEIRPWREALERGDRLGSSLTRESLRPDITIEVTRESRPPAILVLDAKSTDAFNPRKFREMADYSRQVFEPRTGRQPVRQVFLLHRDRMAYPWENLPGYLANDRPVAPDAAILGAVACVPDRMKETPGLLARVIDRFLEVHAALPIS